ncbi:MAG: DEAD/DEAH box helicase family protein, partial [Gemmatimonadota bacterium]|nr:DEAD/DEAH box helicase family protein [Gemmatimonadota bacterium]
MNKKLLNEAEICDAFITPAIIEAGWDQRTQIRREYTFTDGRVIVRGKLGSRGKKKRADYLLFYQSNLPLAVVEAKDNSHPLGGGMQQALGYAEALDVPFVFASNGDAFLFHDRTGQSDSIEKQVGLDEFPSPDELWRQYRAWKRLDEESDKLVRQPYYSDPGKGPRYYQRVAIQRAVEAITRGQRRVLMVMATGTGKTFSVFQIIWRLWKAEKVK